MDCNIRNLTLTSFHPKSVTNPSHLSFTIHNPFPMLRMSLDTFVWELRWLECNEVAVKLSKIHFTFNENTSHNYWIKAKRDVGDIQQVRWMSQIILFKLLHGSANDGWGKQHGHWYAESCFPHTSTHDPTFFFPIDCKCRANSCPFPQFTGCYRLYL